MFPVVRSKAALHIRVQVVTWTRALTFSGKTLGMEWLNPSGRGVCNFLRERQLFPKWLCRFASHGPSAAFSPARGVVAL